jgi:predicted NUDIX family phosphoesterase
MNLIGKRPSAAADSVPKEGPFPELAVSALAHILVMVQQGVDDKDLQDIERRCRFALASAGVMDSNPTLADYSDAAYQAWLAQQPKSKPPVLVIDSKYVRGLCGFLRQPLSLAISASYNPTVAPVGIDVDDGSNAALFMPRAAAETDPRFKQLVGYCMVCVGDKILTYRRPAKNTEQRLAGLRSLGFGGHTEPEDLSGGSDSALFVVCNALKRELREELAIENPKLEHLGLLNHDDTPVGSVHLGVVYTVQLSAGSASYAPSDEIDGLELLTVEEAYKHLDEFEVWSQFLLRYLNSAQG